MLPSLKWVWNKADDLAEFIKHWYVDNVSLKSLIESLVSVREELILKDQKENFDTVTNYLNALQKKEIERDWSVELRQREALTKLKLDLDFWLPDWVKV